MRSDIAIKAFVDSFKGGFDKKRDDDDYYWIYNAFDEHIAYAVVEISPSKSVDVDSLRIEAQRLLKLFNKRFNPLVIWELGDKLAYIRAQDISGSISMDLESMELVVSVDPRKNPVKFI